jgi:hypothetical protein
MLLLLMFIGVCSAQRPSPAITGSTISNEVSADFLLPIKDQSHIGFGGQVATTHFLSDNVGVQLQGDYLKTNEYDLHDAGVRVGPIVRFWSQHSIQPYARVLLGYARVRSSYLKPTGSYQGGGSIMFGGGLDFPLSSGWYGKLGADLQDDWGTDTEAGRVLVGVSYRFNARQRRQ